MIYQKSRIEAVDEDIKKRSYVYMVKLAMDASMYSKHTEHATCSWFSNVDDCI